MGIPDNANLRYVRRRQGQLLNKQASHFFLVRLDMGQIAHKHRPTRIPIRFGVRFRVGRRRDNPIDSESSRVCRIGGIGHDGIVELQQLSFPCGNCFGSCIVMGQDDIGTHTGLGVGIDLGRGDGHLLDNAPILTGRYLDAVSVCRNRSQANRGNAEWRHGYWRVLVVGVVLVLVVNVLAIVASLLENPLRQGFARKAQGNIAKKDGAFVDRGILFLFFCVGRSWVR